MSWLRVAVLCSALTLARAAGHEEGCALPSNIRPVVLVNGFGSGALLDSANGFNVAFPDLEREPEDNLGFFGNITEDLTLSLTWNATDLTQEESPLGPEASPDDVLPGVAGPVRDALLAGNAQVVAIVAGWEAAVGGNATLLFPVAYDWRRDFFEQSERVFNMVMFAKEETGCNPIIVAISFGGLLSYTAFTRYGADLADNVHGVLYSVAPLTPMAGGAGILTTGFPGDPSTDPVFTGDVLFSYPSIWALTNPLSASCVNAPLEDGGEVQQCMPGEIDSGVSCESAGAACGRPDDFTDPQFYLPINLQDPETYETTIVGLTALRALQDEPPVLTEEELTHIEFVTQAVARVHEGSIGAKAEEVAALHPPTITLSMTLGNISLPGADEPIPFSVDTALECLTPEGVTEGNSSMPQCQALGPTRTAPTDGLLPSESTFLLNAEAFGDKLQVLNATVPPDFWLQVVAADGMPAVSPHAVSLFTAVQPLETFANCSEYETTVSFGADEYPSLDDMLCSLVLQGNLAHAAEDADAPAAAPADAPVDVSAAGGDGVAAPGTGGEVTDAPSSAHSSKMHGAAYTWCLSASIISVIAGVSM